MTKFLLNKLRIFHTIIRYIYCFIISNRIKVLLNPFNALFNPVVSPFHPCPSPFMPLPAPPAIRPRPIQPHLGIYPRFKYTMEKHKTFVTHLSLKKGFNIRFIWILIQETDVRTERDTDIQRNRHTEKLIISGFGFLNHSSPYWVSSVEVLLPLSLILMRNSQILIIKRFVCFTRNNRSFIILYDLFVTRKGCASHRNFNESTCEAVVAWINIDRSFYNYSIVLKFLYVDTVNK